MSLSTERQPARNQNPKRLVIFLHGYGSNGQDLISLAPYFAQIDPDADFLSPNAPNQNAFNPMGFEWFPIPMIDGSSPEEMARGLIKSYGILQGFIENELNLRGMGQDQLVLIGFSQGTMMSLHAGLRFETAPAGIIGFSGRLLFADQLKTEKRSNPPVILIHGQDDDVVPVNDSIEADHKLRELGVECQLHLSPNTPHSIAPDGLQAALTFYQDKILK